MPGGHSCVKGSLGQGDVGVGGGRGLELRGLVKPPPLLSLGLCAHDFKYSATPTLLFSQSPSLTGWWVPSPVSWF